MKKTAYHAFKNLHHLRALYISLITVETCYLLPNAAYIHILVSIKIQQMSMNVNGCSVFSTWRNYMIHLCFIHAFMSDSILPDCYQQQSKRRIWIFSRKIQPLFPYHQHTLMLDGKYFVIRKKCL